jgi:hypothetical protein
VNKRNFPGGRRERPTPERLSAMAGLAPKPPFCPLLSAMVPIAASPIQIAGQTGQQIKFDLLRVGCALGADCMLWDVDWEQCGLLSALQMLSENYDGGEGEGDGQAGEADETAGENPKAPTSPQSGPEKAGPAG